MVGRQSGTFCAWNGLRLDCIFSGCAYNKDGQNVQTYELQPKGGRSTGQLDGIIIMLRFLVPSSFYLSFAIATAVSHGTSYPAHNLPHSICKSAGGGFFPGPNLLSKRHWWKKKKKKTFSLFLSGDIAPLYTKKAGRDCFLLSRLCCSEWAKVLSLHLNTFIRKLWLVWDEVRENKNQKSCRTANRWGGKWQFGLLKRRMWWWIWDRYTFLQKRKEKVCTLKEAYH